MFATLKDILKVNLQRNASSQNAYDTDSMKLGSHQPLLPQNPLSLLLKEAHVRD